MEAELKQLKVKRGQIKSRLTRFSNFLNNYTDDKIVELQTRLDVITSIAGEFDNVQSQIECVLDLGDESEERDTFENAYFEAVTIAKKHIASHQLALIESQRSKKASEDASRSILQTNVKLPPMSLPEFRGDYRQWLNFHDTFSALIHENKNLSSVEKFFYLRSCLKGEAEQILQSLESSNKNYENAWQLLKKRFENESLIVEKHIEALFEIPQLVKESYYLLRKFVNELDKNITALKSLGEPVDNWTSIIIYMFKSKLDFATKREWQEHSISLKEKKPTINDFISFLRSRCSLLETTCSSNQTDRKPYFKNMDRKRSDEKILSNMSIQNPTCSFCKSSHYIYNCKNFQSLPVSERIENVKRFKLCLNCLRNNHFSAQCKAGGCKKCSKRHNTLLHLEEINRDIDESVSPENTQTVNEISSATVSNHSVNSSEPSFVLLSTAVIYIKDYKGDWHECRALLDSGSQSNFMSQDLFNKLKLRRQAVNLPIIGINQHQSNVTSSTRTVIKSFYNNYAVELSFLILPKITENIPNISFDTSKMNIPENLNLADPAFNVKGKIDLLLGASIFFDLLCVGQIKIGIDKPVLQKSKFGWILAGPINITFHSKTSYSNMSINAAIDDRLEKFWKLEEIPESTKQSREERECEDEFLSTHRHDESGHFEVRLPMRKNASVLGDSEANALKRFYALENKLLKNPDLRRQYTEFINEYQTLGHMSKIKNNELSSQAATNVYYLPHHGVIKEGSATTKLRVVFDASSKTTSGVSLNDILKVGPKIQDDLFDILIRFRQHNFVLTADIVKMYRQVNIAKDQRDLQRILWRPEPNQPVEHYRLNTVTYGTAPASFLAIRALQQVAHENQHLHSVGSNVVLQDFYVDDLITGTDTIERAKQIKHEVSIILMKAGFELRKWVSNEKLILEGCGEHELLHYYITDDKGTKTLGILWDANTDVLKYNLTQLNFSLGHVTKRVILSTISQIFDPLGLIGPATIRAKIILQRLWSLKLKWDESIPTDLFTAWHTFFKQLPILNEIKIERQVFMKNACESDIQLHGFCDASLTAYGTCIYVRSTNFAGEVKIKLLCAKSRVAPLKTISLPRLELCGSLLLAKLVSKIQILLKISTDKIYLWTDSTIVLSWISGEPSSWQTFVSNRVAQIQQLTNVSKWKHVASGDNPADIISRGVEPSVLLNCDLWWNGPRWLVQEFNFWPQSENNVVINDIPERRKLKLAFFNTIPEVDICERYSSLFKLKRVVAYCLRFSKNISTHKENKIKGNLTSSELEDSLTALIKLVQLQSFPSELRDLNNSRAISSKSRLLSLNPFLDKNKVIRVGGRLAKSPIINDRKFPIILPEKHVFTKLIIRDEHHRQLHAGAQAVLANVRLQFWPLNGRNAVRSVLRKCVTCFRVNPTDIAYQMGDLPASRVTPTRPFNICGIDYAGPFNIKDGRLKNRKIIKCYVCIFICFTTKAIHMEVVGDLTTEAFINALKRFVSRRGLCSKIYSDNATNFVGADNKFKQIYKLALRENNDLSNFLSKNHIDWKYSPPRSPHFGGLWEAAVKAAKFHMKRIIGHVNLTFEEIYTVVTQIEATLNSRPLIPLSNDPNDLVALSPGHFLIGDYLNAIPQESVMEQSLNRLTRFKLLQQMAQHFWSRWSREYLSNLQQRTKWKVSRSSELKPGSLVVLKEDNTAPLAWKLGRITETFPGEDGVIRVVSVKTVSGEVRRAVKKVCLLPIDN